MRKIASALLVTAMFAAPAYAWDGVQTGAIAHVDVTDAQNYAFRVFLAGGPEMCGSGTATWAFINKSYDNYETIVSTLISAQMSGKIVTIYSENKSGTQYCEIVYARVTS